MSEIFHKSCYTSRCSGYKYRTLSTNTGERKHRDSYEDNTFDSKLKELQREITSRVNKQVYKTQKARETIHDKLNKIDAKMNSMLALQETVIGLRKDLVIAGNSLASVLDKVNKMESAADSTILSTSASKKSSYYSTAPIIEDEILENIITPL